MLSEGLGLGAVPMATHLARTDLAHRHSVLMPWCAKAGRDLQVGAALRGGS